MKKRINVNLSVNELFMLDHAIRERINRPDICEKDKYFENRLLDKVNSAIKRVKDVKVS